MFLLGMIPKKQELSNAIPRISAGGTAMLCRSVCPYDCPDACGLLVTVENGCATAISGDPDHPITKGLICSKMRQYQQTVHSPERLTSPLLRTGPKGSGQFVPVSWDEAVERICSRWKEIIAGHGAEAILPYSYAGTMGLVQRNSGHPFFHKLGASRLARTICTPAKDAGWKAVMELLSCAGHGDASDYAGMVKSCYPASLTGVYSYEDDILGHGVSFPARCRLTDSVDRCQSSNISGAATSS
jgi:anaerobic selenocysteine-containing dehydrogenase